MNLFMQLLSGLVCLIMVLLVLLYFSWKDPKQKDDETDTDFKKRLDKAVCKYNGQRNMLLVGLGVSMISCLYKLCRQQEGIMGGLIENMGADEKNLFIGKLPGSDRYGGDIEADDDVVSIISDMQ